jgi:hypothetical protein
MSLFNQVLPYKDSWRVSVNSDKVFNGLHDVAVHDVAGQDVTMHDVAVHDVGVHDVGMNCMSMHGMDVPGSKKTIFDSHLRKKRPFCSYYMSLNKFLQIKSRSLIEHIKNTLPTHP